MAEGSKAFTLDKQDWKKIGIGMLVAIAGAILTYVTAWITGADFGTMTPIIVAGWSVLANVIRKWISNNQTPSTS